jgi:hypothetical protein
MLVSQLLDTVNDEEYVEKILRGATLKIAYHRKNFVETKAEGIDFNGDLERHKVFTQFRLPADLQKFFKVIHKNRNDSNSKPSIGPKHKGWTVMDFLNSKNSKFDLCWDVECRWLTPSRSEYPK